jgi:SAM-dependent methyltransferase
MPTSAVQQPPETDTERPSPEVAARLLALNRAFYAGSGAAFDATRQDIPPGMRRAVSSAPAGDATVPLRVLDAGCGNGRLARALVALGRPVSYTGLDGDAGLLASASSQCAELAGQGVICQFVQADLAAADWHAGLPSRAYDMVVCLATLHHLPGRALRTAVVQALAALVAPGGILLLSAWQFAADPRLAGRVEPWSAIGLHESDVEIGDALLPWESGPRALRYVHHISATEMEMFAAASGLTVVESWRADGRTNDLSLYLQLERPPERVA